MCFISFAPNVQFFYVLFYVTKLYLLNAFANYVKKERSLYLRIFYSFIFKKNTYIIKENIFCIYERVKIYNDLKKLLKHFPYNIKHSIGILHKFKKEYYGL